MSYFGPGESLALLVASLVYTAWQARGVREFFEEVGFRLTLMISVLARLPHLPRRRRWTAVQTYQAGIGNLHVVLLAPSPGRPLGYFGSTGSAAVFVSFMAVAIISYPAACGLPRRAGPSFRSRPAGSSR